MQTSLYTFASDLHDEGTTTVLDLAQGRAGVNGLTLAVTYHDARDLFPHNPTGKVRYVEGGAAYFRPSATLWNDVRLRPRVSPLTLETDPLQDLCDKAQGRGMRVNAWAVILHTDRLAFQNPDCTPSNAFGDRYLTHFCPSHPDVRAYVNALIADIGRYDIHTIRAEAFGFSGFEHGSHHERYFEQLDELGTYLIGLCFCIHCIAAAKRAGVDAEKVRGAVEHQLTQQLETNSPPTGQLLGEWVSSFLDGELLAFLEVRSETIANAVSEASQIASDADVRLSLIGLSGETGDVVDTIPSRWRSGVDEKALSGTDVAMVGAAYHVDPEDVREEIANFLEVVPDQSQLAVLLRPMPPDCLSVDNLVAKVGHAIKAGIEELDFYHYGLCRLRSLDWIRTAVGAHGG
jgi:hypothetical protein